MTAAVDQDRAWHLAALRGDNRSEAAMDHVANVRWALTDTEDLEALAEGDARFPERVPADGERPPWEVHVDEDPETAEAFTDLVGPTQPLGPEGAELLDELHGQLTRYVAFPSDAAAVAVTLWAVHTHLVAEFDSTPRLALLSPEKQCGKTRVLELLELVCPGAERLNDASPAYMFRRIGAGPVTVMLDEADAIWKRNKSDESAEALRSIVNAGHRKGSFVGRVEMRGQTAELVRHHVYAPVALAGIGDCLPDTILDRAVIVQMRRRAPDEDVAEYRERITRPETEALCTRLARWTSHVADQVGHPWPEMPTGVVDRPADVWEPLLTVADLAGGDWPRAARDACVAFVTGAHADTDSTGVRLLADLLDAFRDGAELVSAMSTETILAKLTALDEAPWGDWYSKRGKELDARGLAKLLKPYGVKSRQVRIGETTVKGYRRADLWDPWSRYGVLADLSETRETRETSLASPVSDVSDVSLPGIERDNQERTDQ